MRKRFSTLLPLGIALLVLFLVSVGILLANAAAVRRSNVGASELAPLSLDGVQRLLVLAPHSDDETLGAAGLIQAARKAGSEVRVVIATNGDGFMFATDEEFHKVYPKAQDYIRMGQVRQQESLHALAQLGVPPKDVYFLGYPDRGSRFLLENNWLPSNPYKSPYSQATHSPYSLTYDQAAVYSGQDYLGDLTSIIESYRPDMLVFPHQEDVHPDHWGLNVFTRLALAEVTHNDPTYQPRQITYLVHRPDFPVPRGLRPTAGLIPPPALSEVYPNWLSWNLTPQEESVKGQALQAYKSQLPLLRRLMESFVRTNELFAPASSVVMPITKSGNPVDPSTWRDWLGQPIQPVQVDPTGDVFSHKSAPQTDLKAIYVAQTPTGEVWACAELHDEAMSAISYALHLKALTDDQINSFEAHTRPKGEQAGVTLSGMYYCTEANLADLGNPWAVMVGATVESPDANMPFDQTAWPLIYVQP